MTYLISRTVTLFVYISWRNNTLPNQISTPTTLYKTAYEHFIWYTLKYWSGTVIYRCTIYIAGCWFTLLGFGNTPISKPSIQSLFCVCQYGLKVQLNTSWQYVVTTPPFNCYWWWTSTIHCVWEPSLRPWILHPKLTSYYVNMLASGFNLVGAYVTRSSNYHHKFKTWSGSYSK